MSPIRILVQGDSHGNLKDIIPKIYIAGKHKISHMLVCGDFGLWTHFADGQLFLDEVNEAARINNLSVFAIGGNHENWDHWNWMVENLPTHKGFAMARRRVLLAPKAHKWTWANKTFVGAGGAVSVDREARIMSENNDSRLYQEWGMKPSGRGPRTEYWPNEQFTDEDIATIGKWRKWGAMSGGFDSVDYLFTHDCSNHTPWKNRLKPDLDSQIHRQRIDEVLKITRPSFHFHGHMHEKYDWINDYSGENTRTIGLEAFQDFNSWGVLDVDEGRWFWPTEFFDAVEERDRRKAEKDFVVTKSSV